MKIVWVAKRSEFDSGVLTGGIERVDLWVIWGIVFWILHFNAI